MRPSYSSAAAISAFLTISALAGEARAVGPVDIELAGIGGYATNHLSGELGGRAGVSIFGLYAGFRGEYFTGASFPASFSVPYSYDQYAIGGEVGYGFKIRLITGINNSNIVIRPLVGFGYATYEETFHYPPRPAPAPNGDVTSSYHQPYFQPGVLVQLGLGMLIVGVEGSAFAPTTEASQSGFVIEGQVGLRL